MTALRAAVTARLQATGISEPIAQRLAGLIEQDMRRSGYVLVRAVQLQFLTSELVVLASSLSTLAEGIQRMEARAEQKRLSDETRS